jgi:hypothetical protein
LGETRSDFVRCGVYAKVPPCNLDISKFKARKTTQENYVCKIVNLRTYEKNIHVGDLATMSGEKVGISLLPSLLPDHLILNSASISRFSFLFKRSVFLPHAIAYEIN